RKQFGKDLAGERHRKIIDFLDEVRKDRPMKDRLLIKSGCCITLVDQKEIDWIEAAGNYMKIHAKGEIHLVRETMSTLLQQLDPDRFVRIHRSFIVHLERIKEFIPSGKGEFHVILQNKDRLTLSRKYRPLIEERMGHAL
ncbi:MAG: LytTR family transcriptional regulator, partial [Planctomycetes bacterium]|nr:LytTR family transcriptional regulator [Planctomycetota bacterium]